MSLKSEIRKIIAVKKMKWDVTILTNLLANMKQRIHNTGTSSDGSLIASKYSGAWERVRVQEGRQVGYVDLEFMGDLRKDFVMGSYLTGAALGFRTDLSRLKASGATERYEKQIYDTSEQEERETFEVFEELVFEDVGDAVFAEIEKIILGK